MSSGRGDGRRNMLLRMMAGAVCAALLAAPALAERGYPNRPVRIMVGFGRARSPT